MRYGVSRQSTPCFCRELGSRTFVYAYLFTREQGSGRYFPANPIHKFLFVCGSIDDNRRLRKKEIRTVQLRLRDDDDFVLTVWSQLINIVVVPHWVNETDFSGKNLNEHNDGAQLQNATPSGSLCKSNFTVCGSGTPGLHCWAALKQQVSQQTYLLFFLLAAFFFSFFQPFYHGRGFSVNGTTQFFADVFLALFISPFYQHFLVNDVQVVKILFRSKTSLSIWRSLKHNRTCIRTTGCSAKTFDRICVQIHCKTMSIYVENTLIMWATLGSNASWWSSTIFSNPCKRDFWAFLCSAQIWKIFRNVKIHISFNDATNKTLEEQERCNLSFCRELMLLTQPSTTEKKLVKGNDISLARMFVWRVSC